MDSKPYTLDLLPAAQRQWKRFNKTLSLRISQDIGLAIADLTKNPYPEGLESITSKEGLRRIRIGNYRVVYLVDDRDRHVTITAVGDRKDIYKHLR